MNRYDESLKDVTVDILACVAMGKCNKTSRDAIGVTCVDLSKRGRTHVQERAEALIKGAVQLTRQGVGGQDGVHIAKFDYGGAAQRYPISDRGRH